MSHFATTPTEATPPPKRHPFRGVVAGFLLGLGVNLLLIVYSATAYKNIGPAIVSVVCMSLIGLVLGLWGPLRGRRRSADAQL